MSDSQEDRPFPDTEARKNREENPGAEVNQSEKSAERKLVEAAQNGSKKAFGELIRLHQKKLFRYIYGLVGSFDQAEDIVQESFVKAYGALATFKAEYAFYPWLSTIARNLAFSQVSREERKESLDTMTEKGFDKASPDLGPLDKLLDEESEKRFYKALMAMPVIYRAVFVLRHFENMDYVEIAHYLKIPPGTVDSRLYRARKYLMEELKDLL